MPEDVAAVVFCGKATQASLPTADIGTQCAVAYLTSAGCQTEPEFPETEVHPFQFLAPFGGVPEWAKMAVEGALADRRRGHPTCSCCPHFSNTRDLASGHQTWIGGEPHACQSCQECHDQDANGTMHKKGKRERTPHICNICQKLFFHKYNLFTHMRKHSEKPFSCSFC